MKFAQTFLTLAFLVASIPAAIAAPRQAAPGDAVLESEMVTIPQGLTIEEAPAPTQSNAKIAPPLPICNLTLRTKGANTVYITKSLSSPTGWAATTGSNCAFLTKAVMPKNTKMVVFTIYNGTTIKMLGTLTTSNIGHSFGKVLATGATEAYYP
jgi:hypothetical protein